MFKPILWEVTTEELEDKILSNEWTLLAEEKIGQLMTEPKIGGAVIIESQTIATTNEPSADRQNISPEVAEETVGEEIGTDSGLYTEQTSDYEYLDNWDPDGTRGERYEKRINNVAHQKHSFL